MTIQHPSSFSIRLLLFLIFGFTIPFITTGQITAPVKVHLTNFKSKNLQGEQVLFINQSTKKVFKGITNSTGNFVVNLPVGKYDIKLKSIGEAKDYSTVEIPKIGENQTYSEMTIEIKMSLPQFFTLDNLHFASGQATILKSSYKELAELVDYLNFKPMLRIEISGHTDSDGDEQANLTLSQKRAVAVKNYLIKRGIKGSRIIVKGYGETRPVADNSTEEGKAKNRRTEVRVL